MSFKSSDSDYTPTWQRLTSNNSTICRLTFKIPEDMGPPVYMYYRLTNFYQNHRRYVKSLDVDQLKGKPLDNNTIGSSSCDPLRLDPSGKAYYPCGLIANSLFNDTINSPEWLNGDGDSAEPYVMSNKNIAWDSDKQLIKKTQYTPDQVVPPPNWRERYPNGYADGIPNLNEDEEFMVWMRTAALPTFSKLSRRNDTVKMSAGIYRLDIVDRFPVTEYSGTKSILLSTRTVVGGQNPFMGIAYVVVGGICVLLGALFTLAHLIRPSGDPGDFIAVDNMHSLSASKIVLLFVLGSIPAYCAPSLLSPRGLCGTAAPSESLRAVYQKLASPPSEYESAEGYESRKVVAQIEIDTWFHILSTEENADLISDAMINDQNAYKNAQISYRLKGVTRQINDAWARNADEIAMKTALRKGTYNTLNVYFHTDLQASASGAAARAMSGAAGTARVLGFCTLPDPSINASSPRADYVKDGVSPEEGFMSGFAWEGRHT
ncbi:hypothetical protein ATERTT37_000197 [Aspergillus terreus]